MKKLLFATAIAASAAAFATDPFHAISFESYTPGATFTNGALENNEFAPNNSEMYFYFQGDSNSSVVTNESPVPAAATRPKYFADNPGTGNNANYLALDTEGGTFWRSINTVISATTGEGSEATTTWSLGTAQAVGDGIYLDTMVQFTVTEDEAPEPSAGDKLAIWLGVVTNAQGEVTGTNLMVKAGYYDQSGTLGSASFTLTGKTINAGEWYRLTVSVIDDLVDQSSEFADSFKLPAFVIKVDGVTMTATTATMDTTFAQGLATSTVITSDTAANLANGAVFVSIEAGTPGTATTIQGVGFQGTGAIDDLVLTTDDPFAGVAPTVVDFTLTLTTDQYVAGVEITTNDVAVVFDNGAAQIPSNTVVKVAQPTFTQGYQLASFSVDGTVVSDPTFPYEFTMEAAKTLAFAASQIPETYPTYINTSDTTIKGKYDTWKSTYQADTASQWESAFLLNMDPTASVAEGTALLKIASITEVSGGWELEIVSDATTLTATDGSVLVGNGYLRIIAADTLAGLTNATPSYIPVSVTSGKITVTVPTANGKFMKAELTTEAPANN